MFFDDACVDFVEVETSLVGFEGLRGGAGRGEGGGFYFIIIIIICVDE